MRAPSLVAALLVAALAVAPAASAHVLPDEVVAASFPCHPLEETLGQSVDCVGGFTLWLAIVVAQHNCGHLFGGC